MREVIKETIVLLDMHASDIWDSNTIGGKFNDSNTEDDYEYHLSLISSLQNIIGEGEDTECQNDLAEYVYTCPDCGWMGTSDQELICEDCGKAHEVECPECHEASLFLRCISFGGCAVGEDSGCCGNCSGEKSNTTVY